ncbi:hypothetical protein BJ138DRAFT_1159556, partial [Hygrophoropsis aurantiaca]
MVAFAFKTVSAFFTFVTVVNGFCDYTNYDKGYTLQFFKYNNCATHQKDDHLVIQADLKGLLELDPDDPKNEDKFNMCRCISLPKSIAGKLGSLVFEPEPAREWPVEVTLWSGEICAASLSGPWPARTLGTLKVKQAIKFLPDDMRLTKSVNICGLEGYINWKKVAEKARKANDRAREAERKDYIDRQRKKEAAERAKKHPPPKKSWWKGVKAKVKGAVEGAKEEGVKEVKGAEKGLKNTVHGHHVTKTEVGDMGAVAVAGGVAAE